jgi:rare lipoprotein A
MLSLMMYMITGSFKICRAYYIFMLGLIVFLGLTLNSEAQRSDTAVKANKKKTTRVFYGQASFYSSKFNGRRTASGEIFDQKKMTCACNVLPLGTWVKVTNLRNKRTVIVKINDRIHPKMRRVVDLSKAAAQKLGFISSGLTRVKVEVVPKNSISN